jgi:hypothetical protein
MASGAYTALYRFLLRRWWLTFIVLGASFVLGGLLTLNLLHVLAANLEFLSMFGVTAVRDGGLLQLIEIVVSGYFAAAFYVVFKLCEKVLVERLIMNDKGRDS